MRLLNKSAQFVNKCTDSDENDEDFDDSRRAHPRSNSSSALSKFPHEVSNIANCVYPELEAWAFRPEVFVYAINLLKNIAIETILASVQ